jgi:tRNA A-37 threonylcarbamoyl transferase component Bud32
MFDFIGKTIGPYRITEQVGAGGMATVYKAYQPSMDRYVAIKVLPYQLSKDEQFTKRFQREARAIAKLEHVHILPVHDYGEHEGIAYIVMRYVEAGTLKDYMAQGPLPLDEVERLISQIGSALDYAHRLGVIHRDIKPGNVLVDEQRDTYLTDFGLARMMEPSQQLTASGVGVGTPAYMSPEQGQGAKADHRSDIYSLGVILYEMVVGRVPFEAETPLAVVLKHITDSLPLPHEVNPDVPEAVERVILKALAKAPADRFQTAGEMVQALTVAVRQVGAAQPRPAAEAEQPVATPARPAPLSAREDVSLITRIQRTWEQPRGKVALIGGVAVVVLLVGFLLTRLPGSVQIVAPGGGTTATVQPTSTPATLQLAGDKPGKVLFEDSFDTGLSFEWSSVDPGWRADTVEGRTVLRGSGPNDGNFASYMSDWSNYALQADFKFLKPAQQGGYHIQLFTRWSGCGERVAWLASYTVDIFPNRLELLKGACDKPGEWLPLAQIEREVDPAQWHTVQFNVAGNRIQVYLDGGQAFDVIDEDSPISSGGFALVTNDGGEALFDNVRVTEIIPRPTCGAGETELFFDGFDDEAANGWDFYDETTPTAPWPIEAQDGNHVLVGNGHQFAYLGLNDNWEDYALHAKVRTISGAAHLIVRNGEERYFVGFPGGTLSRGHPGEPVVEFQPVADDKWHALTLSAVGGHIEVIWDGELVAAYDDPKPFLTGWAALENLDGEVWYDNVLVCGIPAAAATPTLAISSTESPPADQARPFAEPILQAIADRWV